MMSLQEFATCVCRITAKDGEAENRTMDDILLNKTLSGIYDKVVHEFLDRGRNLERWLTGQPCVFISDRTGQSMTVVIGNDIEAIYQFLEFCRRINSHQMVDEDFRTYLDFCISRSQCSDLAEEC